MLDPVIRSTDMESVVQCHELCCCTGAMIVSPADNGSPTARGAPGEQQQKLLDSLSAAMVVCNGVDVERAASWVISMETLGKLLVSQQGETAEREKLVRVIMVRCLGNSTERSEAQRSVLYCLCIQKLQKLDRNCPF